MHRLTRETEILVALAAFGVEQMVLTPIRFKAQAELLDSADIIGLHGGGFSALVFCRKRTKLIDIISRDWMPPCYFALVHAEGVYYSLGTSEPVCRARNGFGQSADLALRSARVAADDQQLVAPITI